MLNLKSTAIASIAIAFFSAASAHEEAMPVTYPVAEPAAPAEGTSCKRAQDIAAIYHELEKTDGNVAPAKEQPACDEDGNVIA